MARTKNLTDIPERLIKAGRDLFWRDGYNATGVQQITQTAGVPKGSFYNHFESKEAFAAVVIDHYAAHLCRSWEMLVSAAPKESALATIEYVLDQLTDHHERQPGHLGCLMGNFAGEVATSSDLCRQALRIAQISWQERLAELIRKGQAHGTIRGDVSAGTLSDFVWDVWQGALLRMKIEGSAEPVRQSVALMIDHLLRPGPTRPNPAAERPGIVVIQESRRQE